MSEPAPARPDYVEPARSYAGVWITVALLVAACLFDTTLTGSRVHLIAWIVAGAVIVGIYALAVRTARSLRTITITDAEVTVGDATLDRASITGVERDVDATRPVLGQTLGGGLPRGVRGLTVVLSDGARMTVPTRYPSAVADVLAVPTDVPAVRPAEPADLAVLVDVERRAATLFRVSGMQLPEQWSGIDGIDETAGVFVIGRPAFGFIRLAVVDGLANIAGLALVPAHVRQGMGTQLLETAADWARGQGYRAMTVTAYADVAWNAAFFAARGFAEAADVGPGMTHLREREREAGLDLVGRRVVLRRDL